MTERSLGAAGLTALLVGLFAAPWGYGALGAFQAFGWPAPLIFVGGLGPSTLWLAIEGFAPPRGLRPLRAILGALAAATSLVLLIELSAFTLMGQAARIGLLCGLWLACASIWLVVSLFVGERGPEQRLRALLRGRERTALATAASGFVALVALASLGLMAPMRFPG